MALTTTLPGPMIYTLDKNDIGATGIRMYITNRNKFCINPLGRLNTSSSSNRWIENLMLENTLQYYGGSSNTSLPYLYRFFTPTDAVNYDGVSNGEYVSYFYTNTTGYASGSMTQSNGSIFGQNVMSNDASTKKYYIVFETMATTVTHQHNSVRILVNSATYALLPSSERNKQNSDSSYLWVSDDNVEVGYVVIDSSNGDTAKFTDQDENGFYGKIQFTFDTQQLIGSTLTNIGSKTACVYVIPYCHMKVVSFEGSDPQTLNGTERTYVLGETNTLTVTVTNKYTDEDTVDPFSGEPATIVSLIESIMMVYANVTTPVNFNVNGVSTSRFLTATDADFFTVWGAQSEITFNEFGIDELVGTYKFSIQTRIRDAAYTIPNGTRLISNNDSEDSQKFNNMIFSMKYDHFIADVTAIIQDSVTRDNNNPNVQLMQILGSDIIKLVSLYGGTYTLPENPGLLDTATLVIENRDETEDTTIILSTTGIYGSNIYAHNSIYVMDGDVSIIISPGKKRVFIRVMYANPDDLTTDVWEYSQESISQRVR